MGYWLECRAQDDIEPWQNESNAHKVQSKYISTNSVFPVDIVTELKFLGVIIDQYLSFNSHVTCVVQKAQKRYFSNSKGCQLQPKSCPCFTSPIIYFNLLYAGHFSCFKQNTNWIPGKCAEIIHKDDFTQFQMILWTTKCFIFTPLSTFWWKPLWSPLFENFEWWTPSAPQFYTCEAGSLLRSFCKIEGQYFSEIQNN